jgi:hypothetical protein
MSKRKTWTPADFGYPLEDAGDARPAKHACNRSQNKRLESFFSTLTKRQLEMFLEDVAKLDYLDPEPLPHLETSKADYLKAYYEKCWKSGKKREAFDFVRAWYGRAIWNKEARRRTKHANRLNLLKVLLRAFDELDLEFCRGLADAVQVLRDRIYNSKNPNIGVGDTSLNKWLLEYKAMTPNAVHTARELNDGFVSKICKISPKKLRERCRALDIPLKPDRRGRAAARYGREGQMAPHAHKKGLIG